MAKWGTSRVEFLALWPEIKERLASGQSLNSIYDDLRDAGSVTMCRSAFYKIRNSLDETPPPRRAKAAPAPAAAPPAPPPAVPAPSPSSPPTVPAAGRQSAAIDPGMPTMGAKLDFGEIWDEAEESAEAAEEAASATSTEEEAQPAASAEEDNPHAE